MTREEAIDVLKHNYPSSCYEDLCKAVDLAIKALEQAEECEDTISRQAAIRLVHKNYDTILDFRSDGRTVADSFEDIINALPSAQPKQRWTLCSEGLPECSEPYYSYIPEIDGCDGELSQTNPVLVYGKNSDGYSYDVAVCIHDSSDNSDWWQAYDLAENEITDVIAWMPLPEPYDPLTGHMNPPEDET